MCEGMVWLQAVGMGEGNMRALVRGCVHSAAGAGGAGAGTEETQGS